MNLIHKAKRDYDEYVRSRKSMRQSISKTGEILYDPSSRMFIILGDGGRIKITEGELSSITSYYLRMKHGTCS